MPGRGIDKPATGIFGHLPGCQSCYVLTSHEGNLITRPIGSTGRKRKRTRAFKPETRRVMNDQNDGLSRPGRARRENSGNGATTASEERERFVLLTRLSWDLHGLGVCTSLVVPVAGQPVLEIRTATGAALVRVTVARRYCGWAYVWRPWWARLWRRGEWVWAEAENAADMVMSAVTA